MFVHSKYTTYRHEKSIKGEFYPNVKGVNKKLNIKNFNNLRLESDSCVFADVSKLGSHSSEGFMVTAYMMRSIDEYSKNKIEVRKKENEVSLLVYRFGDSKIPDYWKDAELLFSWEQE